MAGVLLTNSVGVGVPDAGSTWSPPSQQREASPPLGRHGQARPQDAWRMPSRATLKTHPLRPLQNVQGGSCPPQPGPALCCWLSPWGKLAPHPGMPTPGRPHSPAAGAGLGSGVTPWSPLCARPPAEEPSATITSPAVPPPAAPPAVLTPLTLEARVATARRAAVGGGRRCGLASRAGQRWPLARWDGRRRCTSVLHGPTFTLFSWSCLVGVCFLLGFSFCQNARSKRQGGRWVCSSSVGAGGAVLWVRPGQPHSWPPASPSQSLPHLHLDSCRLLPGRGSRVCAVGGVAVRETWRSSWIPTSPYSLPSLWGSEVLGLRDPGARGRPWLVEGRGVCALGL